MTPRYVPEKDGGQGRAPVRCPRAAMANGGPVTRVLAMRIVAVSGTAPVARPPGAADVMDLSATVIAAS